jgi:hypothetical protein
LEVGFFAAGFLAVALVVALAVALVVAFAGAFLAGAAFFVARRAGFAAGSAAVAVAADDTAELYLSMSRDLWRAALLGCITPFSAALSRALTACRTAPSASRRFPAMSGSALRI